MKPESDLEVLLQGLDPSVSEEEYVFCSFVGAVYGDRGELDPLCVFREAEGLTYIVSRRSAEKAGVSFDARFRMITLRAHSSLVAVGLTAAVAGALADVGISANVVAAYHHDHIFVPSESVDEAIKVLRKLQYGPKR
jgi:hypothetical protein